MLRRALFFPPRPSLGCLSPPGRRLPLCSLLLPAALKPLLQRPPVCIPKQTVQEVLIMPSIKGQRVGSLRREEVLRVALPRHTHLLLPPPLEVLHVP